MSCLKEFDCKRETAGQVVGGLFLLVLVLVLPPRNALPESRLISAMPEQPQPEEQFRRSYECLRRSSEDSHDYSSD
jgi:hypothetical protein